MARKLKRKASPPTTARQREAWRHGLVCAAEFISQWDSQVRHPKRLSDILLYKFNLIDKRQIRRAPAAPARGVGE